MALSLKSAIACVLQKAGHLLPNIPKIRAAGNLIFWPIHRALKLNGGVTDVLGLKMRLDPSECVDRGLWFTPHLYDRDEIRFALKVLSECKAEKGAGPVFLDAGANIGFWSLMIAMKTPQTRVIAIEANPRTAKLMEENVSFNNFSNIKIIQKGLGGAPGAFKLYCGNYGNRGGDSFKFQSTGGTEVLVDVVTLQALCDECGVKAVEFMKMDVEGMEREVLEPFFKHAPKELHPKYICLEHAHDASIDNLMTASGYKIIIKLRDNTIYVRSN